MSNTVFQIKRSIVPGKVPDSGSLQIGEFAINLTDKKIFSKHTIGDIVVLSDYELSNSAYNNAGNAYNQANSVYSFANTISTSVSIAWNTANAGFSKANSAGVDAVSAFSAANTAGLNAISAFNQANNAVNVNATQNTNITLIQGVDGTQNNSITLIQGVDNTQNTNITLIQGVDGTQNNSITLIQGVDGTQNNNITAAFTQANNAVNVNATQNNNITAAFSKANSAITLGTTALYLGSTNTSISGLISVTSNTLTLIANTSSTNTTTGTLIVTGGVGISGALNATTKSFDIIHPADPNKRLKYGSLESPYHGVRLTGKGLVVKGRCEVNLPYYIKNLIHEEGINIQLTNIKHGNVLWVENIVLDENKFFVCCDKKVGKHEFYWSFTGIRRDVDYLEVESGD